MFDWLKRLLTGAAPCAPVQAEPPPPGVLDRITDATPLWARAQQSPTP